MFSNEAAIVSLSIHLLQSISFYTDISTVIFSYAAGRVVRLEPCLDCKTPSHFISVFSILLRAAAADQVARLCFTRSLCMIVISTVHSSLVELSVQSLSCTDTLAAINTRRRCRFVICSCVGCFIAA